MKTNDDRLSLLKARLEYAKAFSKKPHKAWKKWLAEYNIEDTDSTDEIRDKTRIGYIFRSAESDMPAIFDDQPDLFIKGRHSSMKTIKPLIDGAYDWLWDVQHLEEKIENTALWFLVTGMGFINSPWVTKTKKVIEQQQIPVFSDQYDETSGEPIVAIDETGQPMMETVDVEREVPIIDWPNAKVPNPFKLFFSPETRFGAILDYENCPYYFEEMVMTTDEIEAKYNKKVDANEVLKFDKDFDETDLDRSEERRVGKECRSRWSPYH